MVEKILLAIAVAFALSWTTEIKPPQRAVASEFDVNIEAPIEHQAPLFLML